MQEACETLAVISRQSDGTRDGVMSREVCLHLFDTMQQPMQHDYFIVCREGFAESADVMLSVQSSTQFIVSF